MRGMMQDAKKKQLASSWDEIPFLSLVQLTFVPSLIFAVVLIGYNLWYELLEHTFSQTTHLIVQYVLATLLLVGLVTFYNQRAQLSSKQMAVVMIFSGATCGIFLAIAKLLISFNALELFRLISEPAFLALLALVVASITSSRRGQLSN